MVQSIKHEALYWPGGPEQLLNWLLQRAGTAYKHSKVDFLDNKSSYQICSNTLKKERKNVCKMNQNEYV